MKADFYKIKKKKINKNNGVFIEVIIKDSS